MHFNQDASLQHDLVVVVLGREGPPALGPLLLEEVDGGHGAVSPQHVQRAEPRTPGAPGELGQVQRDRAQEVILGERVRIPHLEIFNRQYIAHKRQLLASDQFRMFLFLNQDMQAFL